MQQLSPPVQTPAHLEPAELIIRRKGYRVDYLTSDDGSGERCAYAKFGQYEADISVIRWIGADARGWLASLSIRQGAFSVQIAMNPAELRQLALALNVAADEAEANALQELPQ